MPGVSCISQLATCHLNSALANYAPLLDTCSCQSLCFFAHQQCGCNALAQTLRLAASDSLTHCTKTFGSVGLWHSREAYHLCLQIPETVLGLSNFYKQRSNR